MGAVIDYYDEITLDIAGTFDVALARNRLRQLGDHYELSTVLRARAAAAITSICEIVLFKAREHAAQLQLRMIVIGDGQRVGMEFQFMAAMTHDIAQNYPVAEWQLERACDEMRIDNRGEYDFITMRVWCNRR